MPIETLEKPNADKAEYAQETYYQDLLQAIRGHSDDAESLRGSKEQMMARYPESQQEIEIFFDFSEYLEINRDIENKVRCDPSERRKKFQSLTEWHFLVTNYLIHNKENKQGVATFWNQLRGLSRDVQYGENRWARARSGMGGQATTYLTLEALGFKPEMATPADDAFHAEDLRCQLPGKELSVQTKTGVSFEEVGFVSYPSTMVGKNLRFSTKTFNQELPHFRGSLDALKEKLAEKDEKFNSIEIDIPRKPEYYDFDTGKPTARCLNEFREKLKAYRA